MKKTLLKTIYNFGGFAPFHWARKDQVLILTYHRFSADKEPDKVSRAEFAEHLGYLKKYNRVLSLTEAVDLLTANEKLPPNATVITIDDGYRDAYEVAFPVLAQFGLPATLYAVTDFLDGKCWLWTDLMRYVLFSTEKNSVKIEFDNADMVDSALNGVESRLTTAGRLNARLKKMPDELKRRRIEEIAALMEVEIPALPTAAYAPVSWEQAAEMEAGNLKVESHTVTHPILTNIDQAGLDFELTASKHRLEQALNKKVEHFCYPNGTFNENVRVSVDIAGYRSAVTTDYGFNEKNSPRFTLTRIDALPAIESFAQSVSGFEALKLKIRK